MDYYLENILRCLVDLNICLGKYWYFWLIFLGVGGRWDKGKYWEGKKRFKDYNIWVRI